MRSIKRIWRRWKRNGKLSRHDWKQLGRLQQSEQFRQEIARTFPAGSHLGSHGVNPAAPTMRTIRPAAAGTDASERSSSMRAISTVGRTVKPPAGISNRGLLTVKTNVLGG